MNFNSLLIGSDNPKALIEYYTKLFGKPGFEDQSFAGWQLGSGFISIGAHSEVHGRNAHPGRLIWNLESTDVKGDFERLKAAGAIVIRDPYDLEGDGETMSIATFADPDDNYFQLMSPMDAGAEGGS